MTEEPHTTGEGSCLYWDVCRCSVCVGLRVDVLLELAILVRKSEASRKRGFFFTLEEIAVVIALVGVYMVAFVQCHLGAWTSKPTEMMDHATDLSMRPTKCTHAP